MKRYGLSPNFVLDHRLLLIRDKEEDVFGMRFIVKDGIHQVYVRTPARGLYQVETDAEFPIDYQQTFGSINNDYTQLALELGGAVWNVNIFHKNLPFSSTVRGFRNAFRDTKLGEIGESARACKLCTCEDDGLRGRFACAPHVDANFCQCRARGDSVSSEKSAFPPAGPEK